MQKECVIIQQHEEMKTFLNNRIEAQQKKLRETLLNYRKTQVEASELCKEKENLLTDIHMLQKSLRSKFIPLEHSEEKQNEFNVPLNKLKNQLAEQIRQCSIFQEEAKSNRKQTKELRKQLNGKEEALNGKAVELSKVRADNEAMHSTITELKQVQTLLETGLANSETKMMDKDKVLL
ncbi:uncharacterized protein LOC144678955 [Cetorhinus maximus]